MVHIRAVAVPPPADEPVPRYLAEPRNVIIEVVARVEPGMAPETIGAAIDAACPYRPHARRLAQAIEADPSLLTSEAPLGPRKVEILIYALLERGAANVKPPRCGRCGRANPLPSLDGELRICAWCAMRKSGAQQPCSRCGRMYAVKQRDRQGRPLCMRCPPVEDLDPLTGICGKIAQVEPRLDGAAVAELVRALVPRPAHQRRLLWALEDIPGLLTGQAHLGPPKLIDLVELLREHGAEHVVMPPCPFCGQERPLKRVHDGKRCCRICHERAIFPPVVCARCGLAKPVCSRDREGRALCHPCTRADPINQRTCTRCQRPRRIVRVIGEAELCSSCYTSPLAICSGCGRTAPCRFAASQAPKCENCVRPERSKEPCADCGRTMSVITRLEDGAALCSTCSTKRGARPCAQCGKTKTVKGQLPDGRALCRVCFPKHAASHRECVACGTVEHLYHHGLCNACAADRLLRGLLGDADGVLSERNEPVFGALIRSDPLGLMLWLRSAIPRRVIQDIAQADEPVTHELLDRLSPARSIQTIRATLVTGGALPPRDEQMATLERWFRDALAQVTDPDERAALRTYVTWHHLRKIRARSDGKPLSYHRMHRLRCEIRAAIRLLTWLRERGSSLAACTQWEIDIWSADGPGDRLLARWFLLWAVEHKHATQVEIPYEVRNGAKGFVDGDRRSEWIGRLVGDAELDAVTRVGGLLLLLFGQPLSKIVELTVDEVLVADGDVSLMLGSVPVKMPPPLDALVLELVTRRKGQAVIGHSDHTRWLFPGGKPGLHLSLQTLMRRLQGLGIEARPARNTTFADLASELPTAVVSKLLGVHATTANKYSRHAGQPQAGYAAVVLRRSRNTKHQS